MKLQNIISLQKLYYLFIIRKVLSVGILKEKLFRIAIGLAIITLIAGHTIVLYHLFDDSLVVEEFDFMYFIIQAQTLNTIVLVAVSFLLIKILFMKKGSFLTITSQFPITNRERGASFLLFELIMALTIVGTISFANVIAVMLRSNFSYLALLTCSMVFNSVIGYLILQLLYTSLLRVLELLKLTRLKSLISLLIFSGILYLLYRNIIDSVLAVRGIDYFHHWSLGLIEIQNNYGFVVTAVIFVLISTTLIFLILNMPSELYTEEKLYIKVKLPLINDFSLLNIYFLQVIRRVDNYATTIITYCLSILLFLTGSINPLNALFLSVTTGLYMYTQTDSIRFIQFKMKYSAIKDYCCLIFSQFIYLILVSTPILLIQLIYYPTQFSLDDSLTIYFNLFIATIFSTLIGILFPPKKENPFSPFIGVMIMVIISGAVTILLQFLSLQEIYNQVIKLGIYLFMIYISWLGLVRLKEEVIQAKNQTNL